MARGYRARRPPTLSGGVGDCDPLERHRVAAPFGFQRVFLDAQQQDVHAVDAGLDVRDAVEDGERLAQVLAEQRLQVREQDTGRQTSSSPTDSNLQLE